MHKKLYNFLGEHNILFNNQFGFRKNNSTSLALIKITEKIKESIDNKKYGWGIIDLRKAFDTVTGLTGLRDTKIPRLFQVFQTKISKIP